ncbi:MAG: FlgD immunoglobulin-like domain containing protein, partial [bacterium]|nr:FlgD immunoglobulin-like domain containing protein [bacterium]
GLASSIAVGHLVRTGAYNEAIFNSLEILGDHADKKLSKYALYDLATIYWYYLHDTKTGEIYYRKLIEKYPGDNLAISALSTLGEWTPKELEKELMPKHLYVSQVISNDYALFQNYPNPFNPTTQIQYQLPQPAWVVVAIYNSLGQKIKTLINQQQLAGFYKVEWNGTDAYGNQLGTGFYWYQIRAGEYLATKKMLMIK